MKEKRKEIVLEITLRRSLNLANGIYLFYLSQVKYFVDCAIQHVLKASS